jgi:hypothetical protein
MSDLRQLIHPNEDGTFQCGTDILNEIDTKPPLRSPEHTLLKWTPSKNGKFRFYRLQASTAKRQSVWGVSYSHDLFASESKIPERWDSSLQAVAQCRYWEEISSTHRLPALKLLVRGEFHEREMLGLTWPIQGHHDESFHLQVVPSDSNNFTRNLPFAFWDLIGTRLDSDVLKTTQALRIIRPRADVRVVNWFTKASVQLYLVTTNILELFVLYRHRQSAQRATILQIYLDDKMIIRE